MKRILLFVLVIALWGPVRAADTALPITYYRTVDSLRTNLVADSLTRYADYDQKMKHWERADTLARDGIATLDTLQDLLDWTYTGSDLAVGAAVMNLRVGVLTRPTGKPNYNRVEFYTIATNELLKVYDPAPWVIDEGLGFVQTDNHTIVFENWPRFKGCRITSFPHETLGGGFQVKREGRSIIRALPDKAERVWLLEYDEERQVHLSLLDTRRGTIRSVKQFGAYSPLAFQPPSKAYDGGWVLIDMDVLYSLDPLSARCDKLMELPFLAIREDLFDGWTFSAMRDDELHLLKFKPKPPAYKKIRLLDPIPPERNGLSAKVNDYGAYLAYINDDSLSIYNILGDEAELQTRQPALRRHGFMLLDGLEWYGHLLLHYGRNGLRVYNGGRHIFEDSTHTDQVGLIEPLDGYLWAHRAPDLLYCLNLNTQDTLWRTEMRLSPARHMRALGEGWLLLNNNYLDYRVVDYANGNELLRQPTPGPMNVDYQLVEETVLLHGRGGAFLRYIPIRRDLRAALTFIRSRGLNVMGDTTKALDLTTQSFLLGEPLTDWAKEGLLKRYKGRRLTREALQFIGRAAVLTNDPAWREILKRGGAEFFSPPVLEGFNHLIPTDKGVLALPSLTPKDYLTGAYGWRAAFVMKPAYDTFGELAQRFLTVYAIQVPQGYILYSFEKRSESKPIYDGVAWLLDHKGGISRIGKLDIAEISGLYPPSSDLVTGGMNQLPYTPDGDRLLVNYWRFGFSEDVHPMFTAGLDLTGGGKNWTDTTSINPLKAGDTWLAHEVTGEEIVYVDPHGQAGEMGLQKGDVIRSVNGTPILACRQYPDLVAILPRGGAFTVEVERPETGERVAVTFAKTFTGFESFPRQRLVTIDPETGAHGEGVTLPPGYILQAVNGSGDVVYKQSDTLLFVTPETWDMHKSVLPGVSETDLVQNPGVRDIAVFGAPLDGRFLGINLATAAVDSQRIVWEKQFGPLRNQPPLDSNPERFPLLLNDGTLLVLRPTDGAELGREQLPFASWIDRTALLSDTFYGAVEGRLLGWQVELTKQADSRWTWFALGALCGAVVLLLLTVVVRRKG